MYRSNFSKYFTSSLATVSFLGLSLFLTSNPANAFSLDYNSNFESGFTDWDTTGDTSVRGTLSGTYNSETRNYNAGTGNQAVITTACPGTAYTGDPDIIYDTECFDTQEETEPRDDDPITSGDPNNNIGRFNYSGNDQNDANAENSTTDLDAPNIEEALAITNLQEFLGLSANALDIPAQKGDTNIGGDRTAKEGSAIKLKDTINSNVPFTISFDWSYLTNDGQDFFFGDSDYGFVVIYEENSEGEPIVLADSDSPTIPTITNADDAYALVTNGTYNSGILEPGNYVVGFGVVDIDGVDRSSALLVDNFAASAVPFEFSPSLGLLFMTGFFGINYFRRCQSRK